MTSHALPAPVRDQVEITLKGRIYQWWGGDNFEFGDHRELHYIIVEGITCPPPSDEHYHDALEAVKKLTRRRQVTINVVRRDMMMREIAEVWVPKKAGKPEGQSWSDDIPEEQIGERFDLGLKLLELGWARCSGDELTNDEDLTKSNGYRAAETQAKQQQIGIWANSNLTEIEQHTETTSGSNR